MARNLPPHMAITQPFHIHTPLSALPLPQPAAWAPPAPAPPPFPSSLCACLPAGGNKETLRGRQEEYAALGYVTVAIDCRYHGVRAKGHEGMAMRAFYEDALVR